MQLFRSLLVYPALFGMFAAVPSQAQSPPPPAASAPTVDLALLKRALAPLASEGLLRSHSSLEMSGSKQGISFTFHEEIHVLAKRPGKFRADVKQFAADGSPQSRLLVVSDGQKVWTYLPGAEQYSVKSASVFHAANDDMTTTGLAMGGFYLGDGHDLAQGLQSLAKGNNAQVLAALSNLGIEITRRAESFEGEDDYVYRLVLGKQGTTYRFVVSPEKATLRRVELTGQQNGVAMTFRETIESLNVPSQAVRGTFQFSPPKGAVKVAALSSEPF